MHACFLKFIKHSDAYTFDEVQYTWLFQPILSSQLHQGITTNRLAKFSDLCMSGYKQEAKRHNQSDHIKLSLFIIW